MERDKIVNKMNEKDIKIWYEKWCKKTKRNGGVLIGSSIRELLVASAEFPERAYFSDEYLEFVKWRQEREKENFRLLTTNQHLFAEWLLQNKNTVSFIGDMEFVFDNIRKFLKS